MASKKWTLLLYLGFFIHFISAVPERGIKDMMFDETRQYRSFAKSLFKDAQITISGEINGTTKDGKALKTLSLEWYLLRSDCAQYFVQVKEDMLPELLMIQNEGKQYTIYNKGVLPFEDGHFSSKALPLAQDENHRRKKRGNATEPTTKVTTHKTTIHKTTKKQKGLSKVAMDGNYLLVIYLRETLPKGAKVEVKVRIKMNTGYLSAAEWPLLPFYGAMSLVYLAYGVVWLIVSACQWRELLRIQFWIGGVIALGMLEKAVLFSEYNNVNDTGVPAHGLVVLALVLSCIKRTLSRILILIVSMGFGIVKPRLGAALHRVLGVGCLYFILGVIEGSYREFSVKADVNRKQVIAAVPLSVLDAVICWWIFMSLLQTMRTLRIRKNLVKLSLYRHFTNILIVSVIASVAFMIWVIKAHSFNSCITDWKEIWIDDAFWHFLFALILLAIMVLWRPTANNQRYAFAPLIDVGEDDDDDMTLSDAFHGMKMRGKGENEAPSRVEKQRKKAEDDLKWVEENIPTSGGIDTALPSLLDSDEEMMTTKLEMSKME